MLHNLSLMIKRSSRLHSHSLERQPYQRPLVHPEAIASKNIPELQLGVTIHRCQDELSNPCQNSKNQPTGGGWGGIGQNDMIHTYQL